MQMLIVVDFTLHTSSVGKWSPDRWLIFAISKHSTDLAPPHHKRCYPGASAVKIPPQRDIPAKRHTSPGYIFHYKQLEFSGFAISKITYFSKILWYHMKAHSDAQIEKRVATKNVQSVLFQQITYNSSIPVRPTGPTGPKGAHTAVGGLRIATL